MLPGQGGPAQVGTRVHFVNSVGHEMVSPVPPALRKGIIPETRSVSYFSRSPQTAFPLREV